jgi:DNA polymerase-1
MIYYIGESRLFDSEIASLATMDALHGWLDGKSVIAVDTETQGWMDFENHVICIQLGDKDDQFVINTQAIDVSSLREVMESKTVTKLFWNAKFDINFIRFSFGWRVEGVYDGFLAECILTTGIDKAPLSLESAVLRYCDYQLDKSVRGKILKHGLTDEVVVYAGEDVAFLHTIMDKQLELIDKYELRTVLDLENETVLAVADIEYNGMLIDPVGWLDIATMTEANVAKQEEVLDAMVVADPRLSRYVPKYVQGNLFGEDERILRINWGAAAQTLPILKALGLKLESTNEKEIVKYRSSCPLVKELIVYKKQGKLANSFGRKFLDFVNKKTSRIHQSIWQILGTGRMSSSEPNLTQIPSKGELAKKMRACFIPAPGNSLVGGDFSGKRIN